MAIDFDKLYEAMSDFASGKVYILDMDTGEIIVISPAVQNIIEKERTGSTLTSSERAILKEVKEKFDHKRKDRYVPIPKIESRESYKIMQEFAETIKNESMRKKVEEALKAEKPFSKFNEIVLKHPQERKRWLEFRKEKIIEIAKKWLDKIGVEY